MEKKTMKEKTKWCMFKQNLCFGNQKPILTNKTY